MALPKPWRAGRSSGRPSRWACSKQASLGSLSYGQKLGIAELGVEFRFLAGAFYRPRIADRIPLARVGLPLATRNSVIPPS